MSESQPESPLSDRERKLAILLFDARTALWREWAENASFAAKQAYEATNPDKV